MSFKTLECQREYYQGHKQYWRDYYKKNREEIRAKAKVYYSQNAERVRGRVRASIAKIKKEVLIHYGNGKCACVRCGFDDIRTLSIDHIKGGGNKHKISIGKTGVAFIYWLKQQGFPKGYQTLCMNCQCIKRMENRECMVKP